MSFKKNCQWIKHFDLFGTNILLRYQKQHTHQTFLSAFCSIGLIIFCTVIFFTRLTILMNKDDIKLVENRVEQTNPLYYKTNKFMLVASFNNMSIVDSLRYFDIVVNRVRKQKNKNKILEEIRLQKCSKNQFLNFGKQFIQQYDENELNNWLCTSQNEKFEFQGQYRSDIFKYTQLSIKKCSGNNCKSQQQIAIFFKENKFIQFQFYFIDTILNPNYPQPISYQLNDNYYFIITQNQTLNVDLYFYQFRFKTDQSILPISDQVYYQGIQLDRNPILNTLPKIDNTFIKINLRKSKNQMIINRSYAKFDTLFSYIGGMFTLATFIVKFFVGYYNLCCYQLNLANDMFIYRSPQVQLKLKQQYHKHVSERKQHQILIQRQDHQKISVEKFSLMKFLGYRIYQSLKFFGVDIINWQTIQPYYQSLKQIRKQTDLGHFLKRFVHTNRALQCLFDHDQKLLLHMYKPENLVHLKKQRKKYYIQQNLKYHFNEVQDNQFIKSYQQKIALAYHNLINKNSPISCKILANLDPQIQQKFCKNYGQILLKKPSIETIKDIQIPTLLSSERYLIKEKNNNDEKKSSEIFK